MKARKFSIIIPIFNEEDHLVDSITKLLTKLDMAFPKIYQWEILLVENGSTDSSWAICNDLAKKNNKIRPFHFDNPSYGKALKEGLKQARYTIGVIFNVDFWDFSFLEKALILMDHADIVVGSKAAIASQDLRPAWRRWVTYWFNAFLRVAYNFPGTDTHGIKVINISKTLPLVEPQAVLHELFDTHLVLRACKHGLIYTELPVAVKEIRPSRYLNLHRIGNTLKDLASILYYKYQKIPKTLKKSLTSVIHS